MTRGLRSALVGLLGGALAWGAPAPAALANGRFPASNGILFSEADPQTVLVRATFGLLVSRDRGGSWRWICERAIGFSGPEDPSYVVTRSGAIVGGLFDGLRVSRDGGCSWSAVTTDATVFVDVTSRTDGAIVALASSYDHHGDSGSLYRSQLWLSTDDAMTFAALGPRLDPTLLAESVEVAPGDPKRVYVTAVRGEGGARRGVLLVSTDGGAHFIERALALEGKELAPFIAAVDAARADRVYLRTSASPENPTRLLVTTDAGKTYTKLLGAKGPLLGFALSADGATLHAGGPDDGLFGGLAEARELTRIASLKVQCLARSGDRLWACSSESGGFVAGEARLAADGLTPAPAGDGATGEGGDGGEGGDAGGGATLFAPRLHLRDIAGPLSCPAGTSVANECDTDWRKLKSELGIEQPGQSTGVPVGASAGTGLDQGEEDPELLRRRGLLIAGGLVTVVMLVIFVRGRGKR